MNKKIKRFTLISVSLLLLVRLFMSYHNQTKEINRLETNLIAQNKSISYYKTLSGKTVRGLATKSIAGENVQASNKLICETIAIEKLVQLAGGFIPVNERLAAFHISRRDKVVSFKTAVILETWPFVNIL